jgi:hypothetical protein
MPEESDAVAGRLSKPDRYNNFTIQRELVIFDCTKYNGLTI